MFLNNFQKHTTDILKCWPTSYFFTLLLIEIPASLLQTFWRTHNLSIDCLSFVAYFFPFNTALLFPQRRYKSFPGLLNSQFYVQRYNNMWIRTKSTSLEIYKFFMHIQILLARRIRREPSHAHSEHSSRSPATAYATVSVFLTSHETQTNPIIPYRIKSIRTPIAAPPGPSVSNDTCWD